MTENPQASPEELAGRLLESALGAMDLLAVYLGEKLGWYRSLAADGPATPAELAARTGANERYAREWLEQQATTGILTVKLGANSDEHRYTLPEGYAAVLVDELSEMFVAPIGRFLIASAGQGPELAEAYKQGGGVSWEDFGPDMMTAQADFNRPFFSSSLVSAYLSQIPEVERALRTPGARVAEIGPGGGWASIAIANHYPGVHVDGFDIDKASVELAHANVKEAGLAGRVHIHLRDAGDPDLEGSYDAVFAFECIHDMPDPISVLASMRRMARPGAPIVVMDEKVAEEFGAIGDFNERLFYGFSLGVCLPDGMSKKPSVGTGTVMRPSTLRTYAQGAGFRDIEILPLEHDLFRFYMLV